MTVPIKIGLYVVLSLGLLFFGRGFVKHYGQAMENPVERAVPGDTGATAPEEPEGTTDVGRMMTHGAGLLVVVLGLALLGAHDISRFAGRRAEVFLLEDDGEAMHDPEYEQAEKLWANGKHLDAIQLMRDHLRQRPHHQFAAIRIAEIYEKDLNNPLAAALEYEQILKHRLPPERWGWTAIHLANLYSGKLNRTADAEALLRRIIAEVGETSAAKKARERLGEPEAPPPPAAAPPPPAVPPSNLPPGFRPRKG